MRNIDRQLVTTNSYLYYGKRKVMICSKIPLEIEKQFSEE
jgi:hypothetical protein